MGFFVALGNALLPGFLGWFCLGWLVMHYYVVARVLEVVAMILIVAKAFGMVGNK